MSTPDSPSTGLTAPSSAMEQTAGSQPQSASAQASTQPTGADEPDASAAPLPTTRRAAHPNYDPEPEHKSAPFVAANPLAPLPIPPIPAAAAAAAPAGARRAPHSADGHGDPEHASAPFAAADEHGTSVYDRDGEPSRSG